MSTGFVSHPICLCLPSSDERVLLFSMILNRPTAVQAMEHKWITMHMDANENIHTKYNKFKTSERSTTFQKFLSMQKLKKAALVVIASNLTQDEVGSLGDIFRRIDQSGDGVMTLTELDDAISRGKFPQEIQADINAMKEELSLSDTDTLKWKAFLAAASLSPW